MRLVGEVESLAKLRNYVAQKCYKITFNSKKIEYPMEHRESLDEKKKTFFCRHEVTSEFVAKYQEGNGVHRGWNIYAPRLNAAVKNLTKCQKK